MKPATLRIVLAAAMLAVAGSAWAQQPFGLVGGFSIGGGSLSLEGSAGDPAVALVQQRDTHLGTLAFDIHLGAMLGEKTAAMLLLAFDSDMGSTVARRVEVRVGDDVMSLDASETSLWSGVIGAGIQRWITSRFWVRGGIGGGYLQRDFMLGTGNDYLTMTLDRGYAFAVLAGAGVDVFRRSSFAIDGEFHFSAFSLGGVGVYAPSVQVGINWY